MERVAPVVVGAWPEHGLETLDGCPVCSSQSSTSLHDALADNIFDCSPGLWSLVACGNCHNAYLNPRPTPDTIGAAYVTYFTHDPAVAPGNAQGSRGSVTLRQRLRRALVNGYVNQRFGAAFTPSFAAGYVLARSIPLLSRKLDLYYRCVAPVRPGMRLLDVGCGNGDFLLRARALGWQVAGAEPDPKAAAVARGVGLDVRVGGADAFSDQQGVFDVVTLSHVIEHVHDPRALLLQVHALLRPGGMLFVETPNLLSLGHRLYGPDWRGLEPPRHLVLFHRGGLDRLLRDVGFRSLRFHRRPEVTGPMLRISQGLRDRRMGLGASPSGERVMGMLRRCMATRRLDELEFLTLTAVR